MSIFKDCDVRGVYGSEITENTAYRLGRAVGVRLRGQEVLVGGDLRPSTATLQAALVDGLWSHGVNAVDLGTLPTPAFYYARRAWQTPGGIMVTASHNPPQYNGFKLVFGEMPVVPEDLQALAQEMDADDYAYAPGAIRRTEVLPDYIASLCAAFAGLKPHHVVVDAGNGSMSAVAPPVLRQLGQNVEELYCTPDGTFPHRDPNPAVARHLRDLCARVREVGAELGIAYDGDGDRVIFVDGRGQAQPADRTLVLFVRHVLREHPSARMVYDLKSSSVVAEETRAAGGAPLMERSGHAFIKRRLLTEGAELAGEISGHYFFRAIAGDDALYATLYLLKILDTLSQSFDEALDSVPAYPITPDLRIPCPPEAARRILAGVEAAFRDHPLNTLDGVRIEFAQGWALARISVTEPLLTLRFEGRSAEALAAIQREVRRRAPELDKLMAGAGL